MLELGAGGGHGDLDQQHELEVGDQATVQQLIMLCQNKLQDSPHLAEAIRTFLSAFMTSSISTIPLDANMLQDEPVEASDALDTFYDLPLENLVPAVVKFVSEKQESKTRSKQYKQAELHVRPDGLPQRIVGSAGD